MEDSSVKAKYVYYCEEDLEDEEIDEIKNINQLSHKVTEYNYGDLVSFSDHRDTKTFIIGKKGKLVDNPDNASAGYLSIPYEITQYLNDAISMYGHDDLSVNDIDLKYNDKFILNNINTKKCKILKKWNWKISWCVDSIYIQFPNGKSNHFNIDETDAEKILAWYQGSGQEQVKIKINFEIRDEDYDKWTKKHGYKWLSAKPEIPDTWVIESGSSGGGNRYHESNHYFKGPLESKSEVIDIVHKFYDGYNYDVKEM